VTDARGDLVARVSRNLDRARERVASAGRDPATVTVVAVCKGFGPDVVRAAVAAGLGDVGENFTDELVAHHDATGGAGATWHFLGALQRDKLARLASRTTVYESVSSAREATRVARHAPSARCFVEVNVAGAAGRLGCAPDETPLVVAAARDAGLVVEGLMCVATPSPDAAAREFRALRASADALGLEGCSMGMSDDLEAACRAGATVVRLGTALFGPRPPRSAPGLA
jgi:uncharacterized pyridoxal phosphate-containing UPF0001 family protein